MPLSRLWIAVVLVIVSAYSALAQDSPLLFEATFEEEPLPDTLNIQYGQYDIEDGTLSYTVQNGGFFVIPSGVEWTDYAIETRLNIHSGTVWLQARTGGDLCSGYYLTIDPQSDLYDMSLASRECDFSVLEVIPSADVPATWLIARIEVQGDQIRGLIDGDLIFSVTDEQFTVGYPTINIFPGADSEASVEFDYVRVFDLSTPSAEATPDATPDEDLSTTVTEIPLSDDPEQVLTSLRDLNLIASDTGQLVVGESVSISRVGTWFEPLFDNVSGTNVVMAGDINFLPNHDGEVCLLTVRIQQDEVGVAMQYLDVGFNARSEILVGEIDSTGGYSQATQGNVLNEPEGNILLIADDDKLSVYVDGNAVFQDVTVTPRTGRLGVSSIASSSFNICHVTNIWAYVFDG